ncbi:MAG: type IV pilin protein [Candidatus Omnitrophica bacterium]|nr:type IV pilin protein [Candidatus Omnitrophota bacterium]MDD5488532.1 type IV pilin protein [Candidatus Omnitrophota bacterium]
MNRITVLGRKGFTMLELLMVVIIIGILATLAVPQYMSFVEKARAAEAVGTIGAIRTAENLNKLEAGTYTSNVNELSLDFPTQGNTTYWTYSVSSATDTGFVVTATRTAKKAATNVIGQTIILNWSDSTGEKWSGSHIGAPRK